MRKIGLLSIVSLMMVTSPSCEPLSLGGLRRRDHGRRCRWRWWVGMAALWIAPGNRCLSPSMIGFVTLTGMPPGNILKISHILNLAIHEGLPFGRSW